MILRDGYRVLDTVGTARTDTDTAHQDIEDRPDGSGIGYLVGDQPWSPTGGTFNQDTVLWDSYGVVVSVGVGEPGDGVPSSSASNWEKLTV